MWVPVCMLVLTSTVLFRSRWCVVISVTSIEANCGQVGIRSPHGCVRSTIRTRVLKHAPSAYSFLCLKTMRVTYLPVLPILRDLYLQPRDMARFRSYIATLTGGSDYVV